MTVPNEPGNKELSAPPRWQSVVSLLLVFHLFFVVLSLGGNYARSGFVRRILDRFAFYTRALNLDPDFTPYYLTHGTDAEVDHRLEVKPRDREEWVALPSGGFRGSEGYKRYQRLAAVWAFHAANEGQPALFARAVGEHFARARGIVPGQVRCRKHFQLAPEDFADSGAQPDPESEDRFAVAYAANAIVAPDGHVEVIRVADTGQTALPVSSSGASRGATANERDR